MRKLFIDFETRSTLDIKKVGAWKYARHPSTEIMCVAWATEGRRPQVFHGDLSWQRIGNADVDARDIHIIAHGAHFEYPVWNYILHERHGWPALWGPGHWGCTLARAAMCSLPVSLAGCGAALGIEAGKDLTGRAAMLKLCRPLDYSVYDGSPVWNEDPALLDILYKYCARDVDAEMEIDERLPEMPAMERAIWELDLIINRRGVGIDLELAEAAASIASALTSTLNEDLERLTGGAVGAATRVQSMKIWLDSQGVTGVESLDKAAVSLLLARAGLSQKVKDVLTIRRQVGKSSTSKYTAAVNATDSRDGRARGMLQYHGANTGRWSGRLIQMHNIPQGFGEDAQQDAISIIKAKSPEFLTMIYGDKAMDALSHSVRGVIVAAPGKELVVADYSAIEVRVLFWEAGDHKALAMYARGENPYIDMACAIYSLPPAAVGKKTHPREYAIGKGTILGCGYGMGWKRFVANCAQYGVVVTEELAQRAIKAYRDKYKSVVDMWRTTEDAARNAIKNPGSTYPCCGSRMLWGMAKTREFLVCRLPSGRHLRYFRPSLKSTDTPHGEKEEIHYWTAGLSGALEEFKTYGGALVENITQAVARDIMANGMMTCERGGYPVILTVHDEIVAEVPKGDGDIAKFVMLICDAPAWAAGCPIAAEGWIGERYRK